MISSVGMYPYVTYQGHCHIILYFCQDTAWMSFTCHDFIINNVFASDVSKVLTLFIFTACAGKCPLCFLHVYFASMPKASGWTVLFALDNSSQCSQFRDPGSEHSSIVGPGDDESLSLAGASKGTILEKVRAGDSCMPGALWHRS